MSTNSNCEIIEVERGNWYYILEDYNAPKNAWDWHEYASAYGPFTTETLAYDHLQANHANPGGFSTFPLPTGTDRATLSEATTSLIKKAPGNMRTRSFRW